MVDILQLATFVVVLLIAVAWYLSYSAARLDRLHAKVEGAMSALDAQLIRRAEAALELANSGVLDPASALLIADAARTQLIPKVPHVRAGTNLAISPHPLQHRAAGDHDGGDVGTNGAHQLGRCRFVAAAQQHNAVNRVGPNGFFHIHCH